MGTLESIGGFNKLAVMKCQWPRKPLCITAELIDTNYLLHSSLLKMRF